MVYTIIYILMLHEIQNINKYFIYMYSNEIHYKP